MALPSLNVDYIASCRRHLKDGHLLQENGRMANAGQLFGFSVECGLKAVLVRASAQTDVDGSVVRPYREHMPKLWNLITATQSLPDGRSASLISGYLGTINVMGNWSTDHRYWRNGAIPVTSISDWELAALEIDDLLDNLTVIGL